MSTSALQSTDKEPEREPVSDAFMEGWRAARECDGVISRDLSGNPYLPNSLEYAQYMDGFHYWIETIKGGARVANHH